jgi:threonylcarbamoyladenosine tRNA methylthiotransferase MtaB
MKVKIEHLGCKLNQAECEDWRAGLAEMGYVSVSGDDADIYILNTCSVTSIADAKSRQKIRHARKTMPDAVIVAVGCSDKEALQKCGADYSFDNVEKQELIQKLVDLGVVHPDASIPDNGIRTRSMVAIQSGCPHFCTYCIVPYVRGKSVSVAPDTVIDQINKRVASGYKEIVITGTEVGLYHSNSVNLQTLLERILAECSVERLRISSLQPFEINEKLLKLYQDNVNLCRHFHISAQSGSDRILDMMNRHYDRDTYVEKIGLIRSMLPDATVTTDMIVGFPGETDVDFADTLSLVDDAGFLKVHTFIFSARKGTAAFDFKDRVPAPVAKERSAILREFAEKRSEDVKKEFIGHHADVLFEQKEKNGLLSGYSKEYIRVFMPCDESFINRIVPVKIKKLHADGVYADPAL